MYRAQMPRCTFLFHHKALCGIPAAGITEFFSHPTYIERDNIYCLNPKAHQKIWNGLIRAQRKHRLFLDRQ